MTRLRTTAPRGTFRVYGEEEFFAFEGLLASAQLAPAPAARMRSPSALLPAPGRRRGASAGRLTGVASLGAAVVVVAGVTAVEMRSRSGGERRATGGPSALGPRIANRARTRPMAGPARRGPAASRAVLLALGRGPRPGSVLRAGAGRAAGAHVRGHPRAAFAARTGSPSAATAAAAAAATPATTAAAAPTAVTATAAARGTRPEFGFER